MKSVQLTSISKNPSWPAESSGHLSLFFYCMGLQKSKISPKPEKQGVQTIIGLYKTIGQSMSSK